MIGPACRAVRPLLLLLALLWPEGTGGRTDTCLEVANDNIDQLLRDVHSAGHVIVNLLDGEVVRNGSTLDQTLLRRFLFSQIRAVPASLERLSFGNKDGLFMSFANNRTFRNESFVYDFMASVNASCGPPYNISTGCAQSFRLASVISGKPGAVRSTWSGFDIRDRPFYKRARSHGLGFTRLATKLPVFGGQVGLDMVRPVYISGDFYGAVFASLAVDEISDRLASVVDATRPQKRAGSPFLWRSPGHDLMFMVTAGGQLLGDSKKTCSGGTNASDCSSFLLARSYRLMKKHKYKAGSKHFFRRKDRKSSVFSVAVHRFDGALASSLAEDWFILRVQKEDLSGDHVQARSQQGAAIIFFAVATVLTSLGAALLVYWKRDTNTMKFAQYKVLIVRLFSFAFLGLGSLALLGENTPNLCELRIWAICIPCNCVLASFIIKFLKIIKFVPPSENRRMSKVRRSVALIKTVTSARRHFTDLKASAVFLILIAPTLLLCAVSWGLGTARPKLQIYTDSDSNDVGYPLPSPLRPALAVLLDVWYTPQAARLKCSDKYLLELLSWSFMMLLTLIATFFAFKTRILNSHLSDTNASVVALYNVSAMCILVAALPRVAPQLPQANVRVVLAVIIWWSSLVTIGVTVVSHLDFLFVFGDIDKSAVTRHLTEKSRLAQFKSAASSVIFAKRLARSVELRISVEKSIAEGSEEDEASTPAAQVDVQDVEEVEELSGQSPTATLKKTADPSKDSQHTALDCPSGGLHGQSHNTGPEG